MRLAIALILLASACSTQDGPAPADAGSDVRDVRADQTTPLLDLGRLVDASPPTDVGIDMQRPAGPPFVLTRRNGDRAWEEGEALIRAGAR